MKSVDSQPDMENLQPYNRQLCKIIATWVISMLSFTLVLGDCNLGVGNFGNFWGFLVQLANC